MIRIIDNLLKSRLFFWVRIIQFIIALAIFAFAALMPNSYVPQGASDHTLHMMGNTLLFLSASVALMGRLKLGILIFLLIPYSLLIEASQSLTPGRQVDIHDVWANLAGLAIGYLLAHIFEWIWQKASDNLLPAS
jgi:glycopeptide antibiotics resistance protein